MKKSLVSVAVALLLTWAYTARTSQAVGTPAPITFATLNAHSQIQVDYDSRGCYHHFQYHLTFRRNPILQMADTDMLLAETLSEAQGKALLQRYMLMAQSHTKTPVPARNDMANARPVWQSKDAGILTLASARAAQLDKLLAFYRYHKLHLATEGSTTYDTITYTFLRDGKAVGTETFKDSSGLTDLTPAVLEMLSSRVPPDERKRLVNLTTFSQLHDSLTAKTKNAKAGR